MKRNGPAAELAALRAFVKEAETRYLRPHLQASSLGVPSRAEELDVAAFVVLVHGAIENFVEGVALWALQSVEHTWLNERRASRSLASLMLHGPMPGDTGLDPFSVFDNLRKSITEAKKVFSRYIAENHGVAMRNLRTMFRPLGIDVPEDPRLSGSLELLVSIRHQWAHQYRYGAKVSKFASDLKKTSDDCLVLADLLAKHARLARP
jgi:hypothetical protein